MKQKLSLIHAPALAGVVREKNAASAIAEIKNCIYDGADMIDLHLSCLDTTQTQDLGRIIASTRLPILALHYNFTYDGGDAGADEQARVQCLLRAVEAGAAGIDMQGYTYHLPSKSAFCGEDTYSFTKGNPKEIVTDNAVISKQCELIERVHSAGAEVLLSCHPGIPMTCEQVVELALFLEQRNPDVIKIVTVANNDSDLLESIKTMMTLKKELKTPVSYHASGAAGMLSRILNPILGGQIAFCVDRYNEASVMEQIDLRTAKAIVDGMKRIL